MAPRGDFFDLRWRPEGCFCFFLFRRAELRERGGDPKQKRREGFRGSFGWSAAPQKGRQGVGTKENQRPSCGPFLFVARYFFKVLFSEGQPVWRVWCAFCPFVEGDQKEVETRGGNYRHPVPATTGPLLFGVGGSLSNQQNNIWCTKENQREFPIFQGTSATPRKHAVSQDPPVGPLELGNRIDATQKRGCFDDRIWVGLLLRTHTHTHASF